MAGLLIDGTAIQSFPTVASSIVHFKHKPGPDIPLCRFACGYKIMNIEVQANVFAQQRLDNHHVFVLPAGLVYARLSPAPSRYPLSFSLGNLSDKGAM